MRESQAPLSAKWELTGLGRGVEIMAAQCQESSDTPSLKGRPLLDEGPGVASHLAYLG